MQRRCRAEICAALRRKYVVERPAEYRAAFRESYGTTMGEKMWRSMQASVTSPPPHATKK